VAGAAARFLDAKHNQNEALRGQMAEGLERAMPRLMLMLNDEAAAVRVASKRSLKTVGLHLFDGCDAMATLLQVPAAFASLVSALHANNFFRPAARGLEHV
jgi:hypothetical protein